MRPQDRSRVSFLFLYAPRFIVSMVSGLRRFFKTPPSKGGWLIACVFLVSCIAPSPSGTARQATIYGPDDRQDITQHADEKLKRLSDSVALIFSSSYLSDGPTEDTYLFDTKSLADRVKANTTYGGKGVHPLCQGEPLGDEPTIPGCTGFLIGPRLMATAGHCPGDEAAPTPQDLQSWCNGRRIIFGWQKDSNGTMPTEIKEDQIYRCKRILRFRYDQNPAGIDFAVFELDRDPGLPTLEIDAQTNLEADHPVAIIGHPHGLPKKIAAHGKVTKPRASTLDYFETSLDTMPGNSGSPVFSTTSYKIIGVHVRGKTSYELDDAQQCMKNTVYPETEGSQDETYIRHILGKSCQQESDCAEDFTTCEGNICTVRFPDLKVEDFKLSTTEVVANQEITATFKVSNAGTADLNGRFRVSIWWSSNEGIVPSAGQDILLVSDFIDALKVGESKDLTLRFQISAAQLKDKQYVGVYVDDLRRYSDGREVDSTLGIHTEMTNDNNSASLEVLQKSCTSSCPSIGKKRCGASPNEVEVCQAQVDGCPAWTKSETCPSGTTCQAEGNCKKDCASSCTTGETRCSGEVTEKCTQNAEGCLVWQQVIDCTTQASYCEEGSCKKRLEDNKTCTRDQQCESSACRERSPIDATKRCVRLCKAASDCTSALMPSCQAGICAPATTPKCTKDADCPLPSSANLRMICKAEKCQEESLPPSGCGCAQSPLPTQDFFWIFGWLAVFLWRRKRCCAPKDLSLT